MKLYEINSVGSILDDFAIFRACLWVLSFVAEPYLEVKNLIGQYFKVFPNDLK